MISLTSMTFWCFLASRDRFCSWYLVLAEVHDPADRRLRHRCNLYQVEPLLPRDGQRLLRRHDAELLAGVIDDPDFPYPDAFVDPRAVVTTWGGAIESDMDLL